MLVSPRRTFSASRHRPSGGDVCQEAAAFCIKAVTKVMLCEGGETRDFVMLQVRFAQKQGYDLCALRLGKKQEGLVGLLSRERKVNQ